MMIKPKHRRESAFLLLLVTAASFGSAFTLGQQHAAAVLEAIPQDNLVQGRSE